MVIFILGVHLSNNLKFEQHINFSVTYNSRQKNGPTEVLDFKDLHQALLRLHSSKNLEYAVQAWSDYLKKDKLEIKKVQRRATKLIPSLKNMSYQDRLDKLKLKTLEDRRKRADLIKVLLKY